GHAHLEHACIADHHQPRHLSEIAVGQDPCGLLRPDPGAIPGNETDDGEFFVTCAHVQLALVCGSDTAEAQALESNSPSHLATTMAATALPMVLVMARASDMKRSMPSSNARPSAGRPAAMTVAASAPNAPPVTPAAPL